MSNTGNTMHLSAVSINMHALRTWTLLAGMGTNSCALWLAVLRALHVVTFTIVADAVELYAVLLFVCACTAERTVYCRRGRVLG
jgi:hypothetical protein